jgi:calcineurin-like phosphoesterase family protein
MQQRKPIFFIADLHCGHYNSLKFDDRPFKDLDEMHKALITRYNAVVPSDGICYFLGDISMLSPSETKKIIDQLNGTKVCILGNHDGSPTRMYNSGFDVVLYGATLYIAGYRVSLSHCPLKGHFREDLTTLPRVKEGENWHGEYKNHKFTLTPESNEVQFHIHGHIHSRSGNSRSTQDTNRQFDVGVPANNYTPVSEKTIERKIQQIIYKEKKK